MLIYKLVQAVILSASIIGVNSETSAPVLERFRCTGDEFITNRDKCNGNGFVVYERVDIKKGGIPVGPEASVGYYYGVLGTTPFYKSDEQVKCVSGCVPANDSKVKLNRGPTQLKPKKSSQRTLSTLSQNQGPKSSNDQVINSLQGQPQTSRGVQQQISHGVQQQISHGSQQISHGNQQQILRGGQPQTSHGGQSHILPGGQSINYYQGQPLFYQGQPRNNYQVRGPTPFQAQPPHRGQIQTTPRASVYTPVQNYNLGQQQRPYLVQPPRQLAPPPPYTPTRQNRPRQ